MKYWNCMAHVHWSCYVVIWEYESFRGKLIVKKRKNEFHVKCEKKSIFLPSEFPPTPSHTKSKSFTAGLGRSERKSLSLPFFEDSNSTTPFSLRHETLPARFSESEHRAEFPGQTKKEGRKEGEQNLKQTFSLFPSFSNCFLNDFMPFPRLVSVAGKKERSEGENLHLAPAASGFTLLHPTAKTAKFPFYHYTFKVPKLRSKPRWPKIDFPVFKHNVIIPSFYGN